MVLLTIIIVLNLLIATYNARMVGRVWDLAEGFFIKLVLWSALVQSVVGYSMALVVGGGIGAYQAGWLDEKYLEMMLNLWYLGIIFPCLASGIVIWLHSVIETLRNPSLGNIATTGWNTFAMYRNISGAFEHVPNAWESVKELFSALGDSESDSSSDSKDSGKAKLAILLVVIAMIISIFITALVFASGRRATRREMLGMEERELIR